jgi:hypothetical protein
VKRFKDLEDALDRPEAVIPKAPIRKPTKLEKDLEKTNEKRNKEIQEKLIKWRNDGADITKHPFQSEKQILEEREVHQYVIDNRDAVRRESRERAKAWAREQELKDRLL